MAPQQAIPILGQMEDTSICSGPPTYGLLVGAIREASLIKKEYCRCGTHPLQVTSSRVRPPLVKGAGHIDPLFPEFRDWPLWFMASIALQGPQHLAPEVVLGVSLHSEAVSPECGRECQETGDCGPTRQVGAGRWGLLGPTANGLLGRRHPGPRLSHMVG